MWEWKVSIWRTEDSNCLPKSHHGCKLQCIWLYVILQKYSRVEFFIGSLLQMLKANDFDWDGWRTFIVQFFWRKMKIFLLAQIAVEKAASNQTVRWRKFDSLPRQSLYDPQTFSWTIFLTGFNPRIDNISYLLQSLDKQSLLFNFYISILTFSLLQIQHEQPLLLVLISTQTIFSTCFNPKISNLRYLCNFSSFTFYSIEE